MTDMNKQTEALKLAEDALKRVRTQDMELVHLSMIALAAIQEALAEQPAQQQDQSSVNPGWCQGCTPDNCHGCEGRYAEQPAQQQEPVAYAVYHRMGGSKSLHWPEQHSPDGDANEYQLLPLYTSPPAQRTWVGLTDEEVQAAVYDENGCVVDYEDYASAIEAKLKEKNCG